MNCHFLDIAFYEPKRILVIVFCFIWMLSPTNAHAQLYANEYANAKGKIEIPFNYFNGFIVVDIIFQKVLPLKFILDTGAENTILLKREYADILNLPRHKKVKLMGSDLSREMYAYVCNDIYLQMINLAPAKRNIVVLEESLTILEEYIGTQIDGILGAEFFKDMVIKIDYKRRILTLYQPNEFYPDKLKGFHPYIIEVINHKPYINCVTTVNPGSPIMTKLLIDTGAGMTALFHDNTDTLMALKSQIVKGSLGQGLGGEIEGYSGKIHKLQIGNIEFNNMISSFQALDENLLSDGKIVRNGLLGNLLLERFTVIVDFAHQKLYLKPIKHFDKDFDFDKSGLVVFAFGPQLNQYYIKHIMDNSPGAIAGLLPGDIILKVGIVSRRWISLRRINTILSGKSGKKVKFKIKRNGLILYKEVVLRSLFEK